MVRVGAPRDRRVPRVARDGRRGRRGAQAGAPPLRLEAPTALVAAGFRLGTAPRIQRRGASSPQTRSLRPHPPSPAPRHRCHRLFPLSPCLCVVRGDSWRGPTRR
eukprot:2280451-Prymnesium_polylepis.1